MPLPACYRQPTFLAVNFGIGPIELPAKQTVISQIAHWPTATARPSPVPGVHRPAALPGGEHELQCLPAPAGDPGRRRPHAPPVRPRGDRLAYSYGIVALASLAAGLIVIFRGETHLLIPLYAVGVFIDFTISQTGMIRHWLRERSPGWRKRLPINAFGAALTATVAVIVTAVKFFDGAVAGPGPDPRPGRADVVHPPPVRAQETRASVREAGVFARAAPRAAGDHPGQRHQPGGRPGGQLRARPGARRPGRLRHRRPRCRRRAARPLGAAATGRPLVIVESPLPGGHLARRRLPRHPRPGLAAGQGGADHDRRPARVRGPPLVGPVAV